ncbi:hypothetical protein NE237_019885 [Protea cynaroides]|uniref:Uncharacterized protein n=1 Tax=Protea cynaroides TaxID=273540 RepID=A0A9Q0K2X6_9MAGN|nr:hypothetical protein NE237_019885 [Protea cynaroides]
MPRQRAPIFERALNLLNIPVFMEKMGKPICPKFIFPKNRRKFKKLKLLKYYSYAFIEEYQFSPSNTPLVHYYRKPYKKRSRGRDIHSLFFLCSCSGGLRVEGEYEGDGIREFASESPPPIIANGTAKELPELLGSNEEDDSVDQKAELFIQRFYEEMRMQRQEYSALAVPPREIVTFDHPTFPFCGGDRVLGLGRNEVLGKPTIEPERVSSVADETETIPATEEIRDVAMVFSELGKTRLHSNIVGHSHTQMNTPEPLRIDRLLLVAAASDPSPLEFLTF